MSELGDNGYVSAQVEKEIFSGRVILPLIFVPRVYCDLLTNFPHFGSEMMWSLNTISVNQVITSSPLSSHLLLCVVFFYSLALSFSLSLSLSLFLFFFHLLL